ncbi:hypothetical protein PHISP_01357 [Aspergillus sp. HF37]|nr:hypothetical protein PHISP_01357 [Aspergillus sp. HF37]
MPSQTSQPARPNPETDWGDWAPEFLALAGAIASFAAMIILLAVFDGRPIIDWESVTLNAVVSVISVVMHASLTFAVAELVGQWKWILFAQGARPLMDFERIDMASRGPLGSLGVLLRLKNGWSLRLGALVLLLAIGLDPFSQQLLQLQSGTEFAEYHSVFVPDETSVFATRATAFKRGNMVPGNATESAVDPGGTPVKTVSFQLGISMQAAVLNGFSLSGKTIDQQAPVQCPTANCIWDPFQTLGVCRRCSDLSHDLKRVDGFGEAFNTFPNRNDQKMSPKDAVTAHVLPNGHFLANVNGCLESGLACYVPGTTAGDGLDPFKVASTSFGTGDPMKTNSMQDIDTLIWSMSMIHFEENTQYDQTWPDIPLRATECALYYCVKTMNPSVSGNIIHDNASEATDALRDPDSWTTSPREFMKEVYAPENIPPDNGNATLEYDKRYSSAKRDNLVLHFPNNSSKPRYDLTDTAVWALSQFFQELLSTNLTGGANATAAIAERLSSDAVGFNGISRDGDGNIGKPPALASIWNFDKLDMPGTFATLATSMTNGMRQDLHDGDTEYVSGFQGTPKKYYNTQWGWIALHGAVLSGGVLFWATTVWNSNRPLKAVPAWKNSSLAVISRGSTAAEALERANTLGGMEKRACEKMVKMPLDHGSTLIQTPNEHEGMYLMQQVNRDEREAGHGAIDGP